MTNTSELLAERYGIGRATKRSTKIALVFSVSALTIAFLIWAAMFAIEDSARLKPETKSYQITSPNSAQVEFSLTLPAASSGGAFCAVEVLASDYSVVGYREYEIPNPGGTFLVDVATTKPGVTGLVEECWNK